MSAVIILAPIVIAAAWPAIAAAASAVMISIGYSVAQTVAETTKETVLQGVNARQTVELELKNSSEVGNSIGREEEITFTKDDIAVVFRRDVRGGLRVCVSGENHSKSELEELGQELAGKVIQQYVYNRVVNELQKSSGMTMIEQEVDEDETIRIKLRSWE